jgi:alpha-tubulin suppressor-like RCC1 family protein
VAATATASGAYSSYAIGSDGNAYGWEFNNNGQLGNGTVTSTTTPTRVSLPSGVSANAIAAGEFSAMAIGSDGHLYAWGGGPEGELGNGTQSGSTTPVQVSLPVGVSPILTAAGLTTSYATGSDGHQLNTGSGVASRRSRRDVHRRHDRFRLRHRLRRSPVLVGRQ